MSPRSNLFRLQAPVSKSTGTKPLRVGNELLDRLEPRDFPIASSLPTLPTTMRDEVLDLYAFLFCQRGFHRLGLTFEQFLLVIAAVVPGELSGES